MRRFAFLLIAAAITVSAVAIQPALAADASLVFSGPETVQPGGTYTYTYTYTDLFQTEIGIKPSGIFTSIDGQTHISTRELSGKKSGTVTVTVSKDAAPGETGTLTASGKTLKLADGEVIFEDFDVSFTASVPIPTPSPISTPTPTATATETSAPTDAPTATPTVTPSPSPQPEPSVSRRSKDTKTPTPAPTIEPTPTALQDEPPPLATVATPQPTPSFASQLDALEPGSTLSVPTPASGTISYAFLRALRTKGCALYIDGGNYSLFTDSGALGNLVGLEGELALGVTFDKDPALSNAAGRLDLYQLHFAHVGELPGRFTLHFKAAQNRPDDHLHLYAYHALSGQIEYKQTSTVTQDGSVRFDIYTGTDYIVTAQPVGTMPAQATAVPEEPWWALPIAIGAALAAALAWLYARRPFRKTKKTPHSDAQRI